jgi:hypothetical protein
MTTGLINGSMLCISDLNLLIRGARRVAVVTPDSLGTYLDLLPFLKALRNHLRSDALLRFVGQPLAGLSFGEYQMIDWEKMGLDSFYFKSQESELCNFAPDIIINTKSPRDITGDLLVTRCSALARVGFDSTIDEAKQDCFDPQYTLLLQCDLKPCNALLDALNISVGTDG